jgi:hypothetical protein
VADLFGHFAKQRLALEPNIRLFEITFVANLGLEVFGHERSAQQVLCVVLVALATTGADFVAGTAVANSDAFKFSTSVPAILV